MAHGGGVGELTTMYDGPRPPGYTPMHKSGAIILGVGGDNMMRTAPKNRAGSMKSYPGEAESIGTFYEGVLTVGYSTDAADAAVHANILAAGYGRK
jgi:GTP cyclohydrolase III